MKEEEIIGRVKGLYPDAAVDVAGEDCSFEVYVISEAFAGLNTLQRQKPILALFKDDISNGDLHALSITARTPQEQAGQEGLVQITL
ncbi:MAG TPA: BolA/IbaG family iron-sulfur metabolism protein [Gammaproteobacteria bacterium]|nr:BolA/IbaG family iron-sulfur metabolism protein [Gammaproteobacteria bacterium]